jgi:hypothetical protein
MEIRPVEGIRVVAPAGVRRFANGIVPAIAVEGSGRMEDDGYGEGAKQQDRGMEEEDAAALPEECEESPDVAKVVDEEKQVNLFA